MLDKKGWKWSRLEEWLLLGLMKFVKARVIKWSVAVNKELIYLPFNDIWKSTQMNYDEIHTISHSSRGDACEGGIS